MSDEMISQEEIDALLSGGAGGDSPADDAAPAADASSTDDAGITDMERDALGEIGNISMGGAATTLSVLLGRKVSITTPTVSVSNLRTLKERYPIPFLVVEVGYSVGIEGNNVLCIQARDAAIIADLMMGNDGTNPDEELSEIHMSAVSESMNQMMGSVATSLSSMFNKKVDITPPSWILERRKSCPSCSTRWIRSYRHPSAWRWTGSLTVRSCSSCRWTSRRIWSMP